MTIFFLDPMHPMIIYHKLLNKNIKYEIIFLKNDINLNIFNKYF